MDPFITPQRVKNVSEIAQWQIFTKADIINFIKSIDFPDISVPRRYASSHDEDSMKPFIESFFGALSKAVCESSPPKASPKKLLSRFHISEHESPIQKASKDHPTTPLFPTAEATFPDTTLSSPSLPSTTLYMDNLDPGVTEVDIYEFFDRVGGVASVRVSHDRLPNSGLSHAHVNFHDRASGILSFRTR
jgi:RNA recognition motif-containing protein